MRRMSKRYFGTRSTCGRSRRRTPGCRFCTSGPPKWAPTGLRTAWRLTSSTDGGPVAADHRWTSARRRPSTPSRQRENIWAGSSARARRLPPTRSFSGRRDCRVWTSANRRSVVGHTTVGAIESGLFYGYLGMVEGLMPRMTAELGGRATRIATGGLAPTSSCRKPRCSTSHEPDIDASRLRESSWERNHVDYCREIETTSAEKMMGI